MRIAFDAKRAFRNGTGLGQYSRLLISSLIEGYEEHDYYLVTPKTGPHYEVPERPNTHLILPQGIYRNLSSLWRTSGVKSTLKRNKIDLYHGLSNEIPIGIHNTNIKSVVTIHDLIFEHYPEQYNNIDVNIYRKKFKYASSNADKVIAISNQTKTDLINLYGISEDRISVCYQSCDPVYQTLLDEDVKQQVLKKYDLPSEYLLYVGSINERKNLLNICKALYQLKGKLDIPLVIIGKGGAYAEQVKQFIAEQKTEASFIFLSEKTNGIDTPGIRAKHDMPAIYQMAKAFIYPSVYEGFGIPVLEALWSKTPVITSNTSCLPETGGDAAYYVDPHNVDEMANAITKVLEDSTLAAEMIDKGIKHAKTFTPEACADAVMNEYLSIL
ncbi:MAG: glycosyltransferase family 4 protein [Chitinophagales bacterium]|nr:glycosyltransferase family 4 protein [Chitinophagaceae bacterium]MCB9063744.1 glycosyltransferase family 4 protein [Chitinophagales bacterium]